MTIVRCDTPEAWLKLQLQKASEPQPIDHGVPQLIIYWPHLQVGIEFWNIEEVAHYTQAIEQAADMWTTELTTVIKGDQEPVEWPR